jgi:hypothetical protein
MSEPYRPDVPALLARLHDPTAQPDLQDILLALLHCGPSDVAAVEAALVERCVSETDPLLADALGEALGTLWAAHGAPADVTLDRLPEVARTAATATYETLAAGGDAGGGEPS